MTNLRKNIVPRAFRSEGKMRQAYSIIRHLLYSYGWLRTFKEKKCLDAKGEPIPWFTYPAIDFLAQFDFSDKEVFEYGSGYSTMFWSKRAKSVVAVENYKDWYERVKGLVGSNAELLLSPDNRHEYAGQIEKYGLFDIIVIDGIGESRLLCAELAKKHLRKGGMVILDNSDLWIQSAGVLRANPDLIQIDFTGFLPIVSNASCTSIFISRDFNFKHRLDHQPHKSVAQPAPHWDENHGA